MNNGINRFLLTGLVMMISVRSGAQMEGILLERNPPQAQSRRELDACLKVLDCAFCSGLPTLVEDFEKEFPQSELLPLIYRTLMEYDLTKGKDAAAIRVGESVLAKAPNDVHVLAVLSRILPNSVRDPEESRADLAKAEGFARRLLKEAPQIQVATSVSLEARDQIIAQLISSAHEALGVVAFKRGKLAESIAELRLSIEQNPKPNGALFYRLGLALSSANPESHEAELAFLRARELGPEIVRKKADELLSRFRSAQRK